jgi:phosphoserine phosphatase
MKAICFDLDGTLLRGTTVSRLLGEHLGYTAEIEDLERRFAAHEISNTVVADSSARHFRGFTRKAMWEVLAGGTWIRGIGETINALRARELRLLLTTVTWSFAGEYLVDRYGFDASSGTRMGEATDGQLLGYVERYCDEFGKLAFVEADAVECGWTLSDYLAIGDSRSDVPLFQRAGFSIALNATAEARRVATVGVDCDDLREILPIVFGQLEGRDLDDAGHG